MKILCTSDLHMERGARARACAIQIVQAEADLLLFGGDLADALEPFVEGLSCLQAFAGPKLFFLGNNDLETLQASQLTEHTQELQARLEAFGFHLLDAAPYIHDGVGFVGNSGWYDGSLFRPWQGEPGEPWHPTSFEAALRRATAYFQEKQFAHCCPPGLTPLDFFAHTTAQLEAHLAELETRTDVDKFVLGIHHVPDRAFVTPGKNAWRNYLDFFMGSEHYATLLAHPKVVLGVTGHTHRPMHHIIADTPVYNVSCTTQTPYTIVEV